MCGWDCPCDGSGCGGCKYGCWASIDAEGNCTGGSTSCCEAPPPTCGCCEDILSGETCLDDTYYLVLDNYSGNTQNTEGKTTLYVTMSFTNCIAVADSSISHTTAIKNFMIWDGQNFITALGITQSQANDMTLTTSKPSNAYEILQVGVDTAGYSAEHCFFWVSFMVGDDWLSKDLLNSANGVFTAYGASDCTSHAPYSNYPATM
jgi:hypothetical protein